MTSPESRIGATSPADITAAVEGSFAHTPDPRLKLVMQAFVRHLHAFISEVSLTEQEWRQAIERLTATGRITDDKRQEWILWSDTLGVSMLVDALAHPVAGGETESTVLGPFYVPGSPLRESGERLDEMPSGEPAWVHGRVFSTDGRPLAGAELDVWQNGDNELYAVQDPKAPDDHLRGRFVTDVDGAYGFVAVRPTPYPIPYDGPVGAMLEATNRHPWRPAHIHMIVRAPGHASVTTHIFDRDSEYLDSDAVFAVKPSLLRRFDRRAADDADRPLGIDPGPWWTLESDFVLAPSDQPGEPVDPGRTA
ncbi:MAG TPA: dioxygenase [Solirubrobacterales bacterium]|nr:dioxygenase [Solirubrobacterales bacterium]